MTRVERDFHARPLAEQQWLLDNTWCGACGEADLGMRDAREYIDDGVVFVEVRVASAARSSGASYAEKRPGGTRAGRAASWS